MIGLCALFPSFTLISMGVTTRGIDLRLARFNATRAKGRVSCSF